jgi:hypothetical protein
MTRDKDRKRIIRNRMKKTGESYTTARAHVISHLDQPRRNPELVEGSPTEAKASKTRAADLAAVAGMSDDKIAAKTGRTWQEWVRALDAERAADMPHRDIAVLVHEKYRVDGWWSQTITVGYERIKGLRERGQRRDGTYEAGRSRTFDVPVGTLFKAFAEASTRRRWLDGTNPVVRTATAPKSIRLQWPDGTIVVVGFTAKGKTKSVLSVVHTKLGDKSASNDAKKYWSRRLDALASVLTARH